MSGTSTTSDIFFASVLHYLYGEASMLKIESEGRLSTFTFDIPEEDNRILREQFDADTLVLQAKSFAKSYWAITAMLKQMRRNCETSWTRTEQRSDAFFADAREKLKVKQAARA
jgi:hypothetical protein